MSPEGSAVWKLVKTNSPARTQDEKVKFLKASLSGRRSIF
jgi:hypothetical protein